MEAERSDDYQRLMAWVEELKEKLQKRRAARQSKEEIRARAHELWEQHGRPIGRDEEFWLKAELEKAESEKGIEAPAPGDAQPAAKIIQ